MFRLIYRIQANRQNREVTCNEPPVDKSNPLDMGMAGSFVFLRSHTDGFDARFCRLNCGMYIGTLRSLKKGAPN